MTYKLEDKLESGVPHFTLTIGGAIGVGAKVDYPLPATKYRTAVAGHALLAALRSHGVAVSGGWKTVELGDFVGDAVARGGLPIELGRHESQPVADIVQSINKWSINWLADRLVMTAAGIARRKPPSMELAVAAMYSWLDRHPHVGNKSCLIDTGSGLVSNTARNLRSDCQLCCCARSRPVRSRAMVIDTASPFISVTADASLQVMTDPSLAMNSVTMSRTSPLMRSASRNAAKSDRRFQMPICLPLRPITSCAEYPVTRVNSGLTSRNRPSESRLMTI